MGSRWSPRMDNLSTPHGRLKPKMGACKIGSRLTFYPSWASETSRPDSVAPAVTSFYPSWASETGTLALQCDYCVGLSTPHGRLKLASTGCCSMGIRPFYPSWASETGDVRRWSRHPDSSFYP